MALRRVLPENHLAADTKDTVKLAMGFVATMSALILGLLVASAKDSYDKQANGVTFGVRLYETSPNAWSAVAVELAPTDHLLLSSVSPVPISIANIHSIGMISSSLLPPYLDDFTLDVTPVPEPSSLVLLGLGALGVIGPFATNARLSSTASSSVTMAS